MNQPFVKCGTCGAYADPDASDYTLISSAHGWRLLKRTTRSADGAEKLELEWVCSDCWRKKKQSRP